MFSTLECDFEMTPSFARSILFFSRTICLRVCQSDETGKSASMPIRLRAYGTKVSTWLVSFEEEISISSRAAIRVPRVELKETAIRGVRPA